MVGTIADEILRLVNELPLEDNVASMHKEIQAKPCENLPKEAGLHRELV